MMKDYREEGEKRQIAIFEYRLEEWEERQLDSKAPAAEEIRQFGWRQHHPQDDTPLSSKKVP